MYTSYIGRRFLTLWNERTGHDLSARQFFDEHLHPLFFAHDKYLQWVPNSPFAQKVAQKDLVGGASAAAIQLEKLHRNVQELPPDASFVVGFPAAGTAGTTSGQVSGVGPVVAADDIYCSWIGGALGIGVSGGLSLLLDEDDVLWTLYEGWPHYRAYLSQRPGLKGNQIDTWNGRWLTHAFDEYFDPSEPTAHFHFDAALVTKDGSSSITTQRWIDVLFALTQRYQRRLTAYVYSLAQTNRTIGFVPLELQQIDDLHQLAQRLFQLSPAVRDWQQLRKLYETHYSFARACEQGSIGLAAIEPAKLQEYMPGKDRKISPKTEADRIQLDIYQLWIIAMLNNQELYGVADRLADALLQFAHRDDGRNAGRAKTNANQQVEQVFVKHRPAFIEKLTDLLSTVKSEEPYCSVFDEVVRHIMGMPVDNFPLFIILTRFRYVARQGATALASAETTHA
ncbi:hypothetical protein EJV47_01250 [Hymenobacter gummosus]|uniref:Type I-B CRISPR-associated protein Cas8b1/Cst1 n=1 Tax=Hymenobacter gummosus TaxID=1776032 RepID=A0A3S0K8M3_9BACT|nr:hypothetical protein [Hymenobacter gummosus]RTQ53397.1 hypothetical protein EJV47_01250 [Hymenobacter gummosus]